MQTTNQVIDKVLGDVDTLIAWANADVEHSLESNAKGQAINDKARLTSLVKAKLLIEESRK